MSSRQREGALNRNCDNANIGWGLRCAPIVRATKLDFLTAGKSFQRRVMAGSSERRQPFSGYN